MKNINSVFLLVGLGITTLSHATDLQTEADIGRSLYVNGHDDWWYQQAFEHKLDYRATTLELGLHDELLRRGDFFLNYGVSWNYLGQMHMQSYAVADSDYNIQRHQCNGRCGHESDFFSEGHDQGFSFTLEPSYQGFSLIGGAYLHHNNFTVLIQDWAGNSAPQGTGTTHDVKDSYGWTLGEVVGTAVKYKQVVVKYQYFVDPDHYAHMSTSSVPAAWHGAHEVSIGYSF